MLSNFPELAAGTGPTIFQKVLGYFHAIKGASLSHKAGVSIFILSASYLMTMAYVLWVFLIAKYGKKGS